MIISYRYRFVFIHAAKTGGSSVCLALYPYMDPKDIIIGTHQHAWSHGLRLNRRSLVTALHPRVVGRFMKESLRARNWGEGINKSVRAYYRHYHCLSGAHATPEQIMPFLGKQWDEFHKFAFVRNPWDWLASIYHWRHRKLDRKDWPAFDDFVESMREGTLRGATEETKLFKSVGMLFHEGKPVFDSVGRFENLEADLKEICRKIGMTGEIRLPLINKNSLRPAHDYRKHYNDRTRALVDEIFSSAWPEGPKTFGYEF